MTTATGSIKLKDCKTVGNGAYGVVLTGIHNDKRYAVKRRYITVDPRVSPGCIHVNEVDILCRFKHPKILHAMHIQRLNPIPDLFKTSNRDTYGSSNGYKYRADLIYILTEAANCDLQSKKLYDAKFGIENIDNIREYMWLILDGIAYIHSLNFIHKDLKPSNILDFSTPDKIDIKVCDFDMCTPDIITYQWAKAMTVEYCPPEILKQNHEVTYTKKVDTWSAGLILYYMVKGTTIFRRNSLEGKLLDEFAIAVLELYMPGGNKEFVIDDSIAHVGKIPAPDLDLGDELLQDLFNHMCECDDLKRWDILQCMSHPFFQGRLIPHYEPTQDHVIDKPYFTEEMLKVFDDKIDEVIDENDAHIFFLALDILTRVCAEKGRTNAKNLAICCYNIALKYFKKEDAECIALDSDNVKTIECRIITEKLGGKIYRDTVYNHINGYHKLIYKYLANDKVYPRKLSEFVSAISEVVHKT